MIQVKNTCYNNHSDHFSAKEMANPYEVLIIFFGDTNLNEIRALFDKIIETCLTTDDGPFSKGEERGNLLCMRRKIEQDLGASYLIADEKKKRVPMIVESMPCILINFHFQRPFS